jgi:hypothetical protein
LKGEGTEISIRIGGGEPKWHRANHIPPLLEVVSPKGWRETEAAQEYRRINSDSIEFVGLVQSVAEVLLIPRYLRLLERFWLLVIIWQTTTYAKWNTGILFAINSLVHFMRDGWEETLILNVYGQ